MIGLFEIASDDMNVGEALEVVAHLATTTLAATLMNADVTQVQREAFIEGFCNAIVTDTKSTLREVMTA